MCNIAGYVGTRPAAPILIEMMRREEGWNAGFYTGLATIHDGKLYSVKRVGDLQHLLETTNAVSLPGTIGLIHGRTPSGGDDEWAHPFVGEHDGCPDTAYVANGSMACFAPTLPQISAQAARLEAAGYVFHSRTRMEGAQYPVLPSGEAVHISEVMARLINSKMDAGEEAVAAMNHAFCEMPAEIVGLFLSLAQPDRIVWSRINKPMFVSFADHGAYLASTPQAFPEDAGEPTLLPACSGGNVFADHLTAYPYRKPPAAAAPITARVMSEGYAAIVNALQDGWHTFPELVKVVRPLFERAGCLPNAAVVYSSLYALQKKGRLDVHTEKVPGVREGLTAPVFKAGLKTN